jgi:hypothetical protein
VLTGIWNVAAEGDRGDAYQLTLIVKLVAVAISGATAYAHAKATTRTGLAVYGALTGLFALASLFVGIMLAG